MIMARYLLSGPRSYRPEFLDRDKNASRYYRLSCLPDMVLDENSLGKETVLLCNYIRSDQLN